MELVVILDAAFFKRFAVVRWAIVMVLLTPIKARLVTAAVTSPLVIW